MRVCDDPELQEQSRTEAACRSVCCLVQTPPRCCFLNNMASVPAIRARGLPLFPGHSVACSWREFPPRCCKDLSSLRADYPQTLMKMYKMREVALLAFCFIAFGARVWHFRWIYFWVFHSFWSSRKWSCFPEIIFRVFTTIADILPCILRARQTLLLLLNVCVWIPSDFLCKTSCGLWIDSFASSFPIRVTFPYVSCPTTPVRPAGQSWTQRTEQTS